MPSIGCGIRISTYPSSEGYNAHRDPGPNRDIDPQQHHFSVRSILEKGFRALCGKKEQDITQTVCEADQPMPTAAGKQRLGEKAVGAAHQREGGVVKHRAVNTMTLPTLCLFTRFSPLDIAHS